jgi:hypothetical protein
MNAMRLSKILFPAMILLALLTVGCSHVQTIHYVRGVQFDPEASRGLPFNWVYVNDDVMKLKGGKLLVQFENPGQTIDRNAPGTKISPAVDTPEQWESLRRALEMDFLVKLKLGGEFSELQRSTTAVSSFHPDAILKLAVTEWDEGNKWLRGLLTIGLGATRVQWEGVLTDARTGKILLAFADARTNPGGGFSFGLFSPKIWQGPVLIAQDLSWGADDLAKVMRIIIEAPPER